MDYKGIGVVFVRTALREAGAGAEQRVLAELGPDELRAYESATASGWVPIELAARLFELAAPILYPGKVLPLRLLGRDLARHNLGTVYRALLRVLSVEFVLGQAARLWSTYHRHGSSEVIRLGPNEIDFVVRDYPRLPERFRECMCGWISGTLEMVGARQSFVSKTDDDPQAWRWRVRWQ
jgi:uncharacterized protein (TIGR02265 family)